MGGTLLLQKLGENVHPGIRTRAPLLYSHALIHCAKLNQVEFIKLKTYLNGRVTVAEKDPCRCKSRILFLKTAD